MTLTSFLALFWQRSQENKLTQAAGSLTNSSSPISLLPRVMLWDNILMNSSIIQRK